MITVKVKTGKQSHVLEMKDGGLWALRKAMEKAGIDFEGKKLIANGKVVRKEDPPLGDKVVVMVGGVDSAWEVVEEPVEKDMTEDDEEIAKAIQMSMEEEEGQGGKDELKEVEFERFNSDNINIDGDTLDLINQYHSAENPYVDPQFPPVPKSIYQDPNDATRWLCSSCGHANPLPDVPAPPTSREEAAQQNNAVESMKCSVCPCRPTHVQKVNIVNRPSIWLRPGVTCKECEFMFSMQGVNDVKSLASRNCTHYLRDDVTNNTTGMTWKVIREAARPEDVYQGALGNCWFGGALSCVAAKPQLIEKLMLTKEYNPVGAYLVQLHHSGSWRNMMIDDTFPCTKQWEGKIDGSTVWYARGGLPCYAKTSRQSLWAPLVEKACAKLFGSYGALSGGTMGEALQLLTGYACETMPMHISEETKQRKKERRDKIMTYRMQLLMQGKDPDVELGELSDDDDDETDDDMMWSKLLSASEAGYIMGMACSAEACGSTRETFVEVLGLQTPHAYGVLQLKEITVNGKVHRMVQCRNPWGERAPRTWSGTWGKDWSGWNRDLKLQLGVVNSSNVKMYDEMSIFWMDFADVRKYFASIDVCRVHPTKWHHATSTGWLPSELSPGSSFIITAYTRTLADVILWQEKHVTRETSLKAVTSNVDIGFAVSRQTASGEWVAMEYAQRQISDQVSLEIVFHAGYRYKVTPHTVGLMQAATDKKRLRKVTAAIYSEKRVLVEEVKGSWREHAEVLVTGIKGKRQVLSPGVVVRTLQEKGAGLSCVLENTSQKAAVVQYEVDAACCTSTRFNNSFTAITNLPPNSRQLCLALSLNIGARYGFASQLHPPEMAGFADPPLTDTLHEIIPIPASTSYPPPSEDIMAQADPEEPEEVSELDEAIKMSMMVDAEEDEDMSAELAEAIRVSMAEDAKDGDATMTPARQDPDEDEDEEAALRKAIELSMQDTENEG
eukprot:TRINITY_DN11839_c1_g2_i1.p1 TRINITY_DN11839_c1_g2~~TRINITY_DN11839_c1_g2_i1.p1  ORF type:complete len:953 (+),score=319.29 TRINITY_DN11839_c1_g2_i1:72-2930(+)